MPLLARRGSASNASARPVTSTRRRRSLQGSAAVIDISSKADAIKVARARQAWQSEAWMYRRALPECRYAVSYIGNSCMRMKLFPGVFVGDHETPVPVGSDEATELPQDLIDAAHEAMEALKSGGPLALPLLFKRLSEQFEVAGECYLVGEADTLTGGITWAIRSVNELVIRGDQYGIRDTPSESASGSSIAGVRWLAPGTFVSRLWWPDPEFGYLADSPFQAVREMCEELLLLSKEVRALARNRLANSGLLLLSDELSVIGAGRQGGDTEGGDADDDDPFFREFYESAQAALTNEGSSASVVPIIGRGPATAIQNGVRFLSMQRPLTQHNAAARQEVIGRMATGLDLPNEVLLGKADLNHWASWQVSDDTFKHHIEPIVIVMCDALTAGFLWPMLDAKGLWDPALVRQVLVWYDPTELVTHPDRSQDAFQAWDRLAISDKALRGYLGFPDDDAPLPQEILIRLSTHVRSLDPAIQTAILKLLDPELDIPALEQGGTVSAQPPGPVSTGEGDAGPPAPAGAPIGSDANPGPPSTGGSNGSAPTPESVSADGRLALAPGPFAPSGVGPAAPSGVGPFAPEQFQARREPESAVLSEAQREMVRATIAALRSNGVRAGR